MSWQKFKDVLRKPIFKAQINYGALNPFKWNWEKLTQFLLSMLLGIIIFMVALASLEKNIFTFIIGSGDESDSAALDIKDQDDGECNVSGIELHGSLLTYIPLSDVDSEGSLLADESASENIVYAIDQADKDPNIRAIILEVDSYGGSPVAAEEISQALRRATKPTVAFIRDAGASAAYYSATGADMIFASENSDVGGIGVTMSYLDYSNKNQQEGLTYVPLSSGKFKDTGNSDKPLSAEERNLLMRDVNIIHKNFIKAVAENRQLDEQKVAKLADGSTMLGQAALDNGLIDALGGLPEVKEYLTEVIEAEPVICW